jgi:hypothetical protein
MHNEPMTCMSRAEKVENVVAQCQLPSDTLGKTGFTQIPKAQRSHAPRAAPTPTTRKPSKGKK